VVGLSDFLVMATGEMAIVRPLSLFGSERTPLRMSDLRSLDAEGARLLGDWCRAVQAAYGYDPGPRGPRVRRPVVTMPPDSIPYWPVDRPELGI
jgi:hypothetical protein